MPKRPTLSDVTNIETAAPTLNANNDRIELAFDNTLSRDGSTPNQMEADLDLNSNDLLNAGTASFERIVLGGSEVMINDPGLTRNWATNPEDVLVDPENFPGEYSAFHYAEKAEQAAADAAAAAGPAREFADLPDLLGTTQSFPLGTIVGTRKERFRYVVVAADPDLTTAGAVMLQALPDGNGVLSVGAFAPVGDGVADDTAAFQQWAMRQETMRSVGHGINLVIPPNTYRLTQPLVIKRPNATGMGAATLNWDNATLVCDFNRQTYPVFLELGDAATPQSSSAPINIIGKCWIEGSAAITRNTPIAVRCYVQAQSLIKGIRVRNWWNTVLDLKRVQNITVNDSIIYGGGYSFGYRDTSGSLFRRNGTTLTRVSGSFAFQASDVGKTVSLFMPDYVLSGVIQSVTDASNVEMNADFAGVDGADRTMRFGSPAPKLTSGSPIVTLDGDGVSADMVGLPVGIARGATGGKTLWANIVSVDTGANTITLDRNAEVNLSPDVAPLVSTSEIATPVIMIDSEPGVSSTTISQVRFFNTQIETYRGIAIGVNDAEFVDFVSAKFHGVSSSSWDTYALGMIWANRLSGRFTGEFDQVTLGQYKMRFADQTQPMNFIDLKARMRRYEKLLCVQPQASGYEGAVVAFGQFAPFNVAPFLPFSSLVDDFTTGERGVVPPLQYLRGQYDDAIFALGPGVSADRHGNLTFKTAETFFAPTVEDAGGTQGSGTLLGSYTKVGQLVHLRIRLTNIDTTGLTGGSNFFVGNLPFPAATTGRNVSGTAVRYNNVTTNGNLVAYIADGDTRVSFYRDNGTGNGMTQLPVAALTSGPALLIFDMTYFAAS